VKALPDVPTLPSPSSPRPICIVTGANTGIGYQTSKYLCKYGYKVILACRSREKGVKAAEDINSENDLLGEAVFLQPLDLSCFDSVRKFVDAFEEAHSNQGLDVLVNNAGINTSGVSADNLDLCFQTNFLGHFLLTRLLRASLEKKSAFGGKPKIINLSSVMHHFATPRIKINEWDEVTKSNSNNSYADSKLAAILFTIELNRRFKGISSISVNPGAVDSEIWRNFPLLLRKYLLGPIFRLLYLSTEDGCHTTVAAILNEWQHNEVYLEPYHLPKIWRRIPPYPSFEMLGPFQGSRAVQPRLLKNDALRESCSNLWLVSEAKCGLTTPK